MFAGAQVSLYPMADGFVDVILGSLGALDPWRDRLRIETDDISTLIVGPPEVLFPALPVFMRRRARRVSISRYAPPYRAAVQESRTIRSARPLRWPTRPSHWMRGRQALCRRSVMRRTPGKPQMRNSRFM